MSFIVDSQGLSKENIDSLYVGHLVLALLEQEGDQCKNFELVQCKKF